MNVRILERVDGFLKKVPQRDAAKILTHVESLRENVTEGIVMKPLAGKVKEIVAGPYRIVFFQRDNTAYVVDIFRKKSKKTPQRVIERAIRIQKTVQQ